MGNPKLHSNDTLISLSDLILVFKRSKKFIITGICVCAVLGALFALTRPINYVAEGTFREKASSQPVSSLLSSMFFGGGGSSDGGTEVAVLMKSRKFWEKIVSEMGLHAHLNRVEDEYPLLKRIAKNIAVEKAVFNNSQQLALEDPQPSPVSLKDVVYTKEVPQNYLIKFISDSAFQVLENKKVLHTGEVNKAVALNDASFKVVRQNDTPLKGQEYTLSFTSLAKTAHNLSKQITIQPDRDCSSVMKLQINYPNRHIGASILNKLMETYQIHLKEEQQVFLTKQLAYLNERQTEMQERLKKRMTDYATAMSQDATTSGFLDLAKSMEFLSEVQQEYKRDLLDLELDLKRYLAMQEGKYALEKYVQKDRDPILNQILNNIRELKQQFDSLNVALHETTVNSPESAIDFDKQLAEFVEAQQYEDETQIILDALANDVLPTANLKLWSDSRYLVKNWSEKLQNELSQPDHSEVLREQFISYVANLHHLFNVQAKTIQERLVHQQNLDPEFQGIDLGTSKELYLQYTRQISEIEANRLKHQFVIQEMEQPAFEISSLSTLLNDHISHDMINRASAIALLLKDQNNRTVKEQERLREELSQQKGFLSMHLQQSVVLMQLHEKLLHDKTYNLQKARLALFQQEISVLQEQLSSYIDTSIANLKQEKNVIEQHQQGVRQELSILPSKWVDEKLIDHEMKINTAMIEELTRLVESKNISSNLDVIRSSPLDAAIPAIHPNVPRTLFFSSLGGILGALMTAGLVLVRNLSFGMRASPENLRLANQHVSGTFSSKYDGSSKGSLQDQDLETLRRLMSFMDVEKGIPLASNEFLGKSLLLVTGNGIDYSIDLATLIGRRGLKVLVLSVDFNQIAVADELPGLLNYLEGTASFPKVQHNALYDQMYAGGVCRFALELLVSQQFTQLMDTLRTRYDWVLVTSHASPTSAEAECLFKLFDCAALTVCEEPLPQLENCLEWAQKKKLSFIFNSQN